MLNKISYLSKSASLVFAMLFIGMIQNVQRPTPSTMTPGPHGDRIVLS